MLALLFFLVPAAAVGTKNDRTISQVVGLLQDMLDKSKSDGVSDRTVYAKFKCYCDTTTEAKNKSIEEATAAIETMEAELADRRAQNTKLSQEVSQLKKDMDANEESRNEAQSLRDQAHTDFLAEEQDLATGGAQLERAIDILSAVGADQTKSSGADNAQLMATDATAAAKDAIKGSFMAKKGELKKLNADMKSALRAASVFLSGDQRKKVSAFLQAPGNYNSQSGEIVGIIKEMKDTFESNLESARAAETKAGEEHDAMITIKTKEHEDMTSLWEQKKELIGNNAEEIATTQSEKETSENLKAEDETFLEALEARCTTKQKEFEKRNMLRANEEAAIAQAIAILNSDSAFSAFGKVDATSSGATSFIQVVKDSGIIRKKTALVVDKASKKAHSLRLAKVASALKAGNPFVEVLAMVQDMISLIDKEQTDDETKKSWCESEQSTNEENKADKETDIGTLETNINNLEISRDATTTNIAQAKEDLTTNRNSQESETSGRKDANAQFTTSLANCQDAEKILVKATEVLTKYYDWLHAHTAPHTYAPHPGKDSGGNNLERLDSTDPEKLEEACSAKPECAGFNSAGWLKSKIVEEGEWYDWEGGDLYVKTFETTRTGFLQQEPMDGEPEGEFSSGQGGDGNAAIEMLEFITEETRKEMDNSIENEKTAQSQFETNMQALKAGETELTESLSGYELDHATTNKQLEEAHENKGTTQKELDAINKYLTEIEPGCTFMISNFQTRTDNRATEKTALEGAVTTLEGTPAFQNAKAAEEREALGKCAGTCETEGQDHAKCQACLGDVTVFGYCSTNGSAPGCDNATATSSAAALA